jgi:hypothetical protein
MQATHTFTHTYSHIQVIQVAEAATYTKKKKIRDENPQRDFSFVCPGLFPLWSSFVLFKSFRPSCHFTFHITVLTTNTTETSMPPVGFEPAIPAIKRLQTYALDRTTTGIGHQILLGWMEYNVQREWERSRTLFWLIYLKWRDVFEDLGRYGNITLKPILAKQNGQRMDWICLTEDRVQ